MAHLLHSLHLLEAGVFAGLGLMAIWQWRRQATAAAGWVAAAFGSLSVLFAVDVALPPGPLLQGHILLVKILVATGLAFPYLLHRFARSLGGGPRWLNLTAVGLTGAALAATAFLRQVPAGAPRPAWAVATLLLVLADWGVIVGAVSVRLWRAGTGEPALARYRMRSLSLGATGLAALLLLHTASYPNTETSSLAVSLAVLASGSLFLAAFAWPKSFTLAWRRNEQNTLQAAIGDLLTATGPSDIIEGLLPHVASIFGAKAAGLFDSDGTFLGARGLDGAHLSGTPMRVGALAIWPGPYSPFLGRDEMDLLTTVGTLTSLTLERCRSTEQERRAKSALEVAHADLEEAQHIARVGSWHWDLADNRITWSTELYRLHGLLPGQIEATAEVLERYLHPDDRGAVVERIRRAVADGSTFDFDFRIVRADGEVRTLHCRGRLVIGLNGCREVIGTVQDVTEQRRLESLRTEFIADAAHELRTPLTTLAGMAALLARHRFEMSDEEVSASFEALGRQGERAKVLIQNMLDLSRLEAAPAPVDLGSVPLAAAVRRTLEAVPQPPGTSVEVEVPPNLAALAEEARLEQVLTNLLSNAYRYGGKNVRVEASARGGRVLLSVIDDGPGVPCDLVDRLFEPFTRAQGAGSSVGSGLGLTISKRLVEAFHGDLTYEPHQPHGSRFTVALKAA